MGGKEGTMRSRAKVMKDPMVAPGLLSPHTLFGSVPEKSSAGSRYQVRLTGMFFFSSFFLDSFCPLIPGHPRSGLVQ